MSEKIPFYMNPCCEMVRNQTLADVEKILIKFDGCGADFLIKEIKNLEVKHD